MKKILTYIFIFLLGLTFISIDTHADVGPKPTADILIIGIDEPFYFDVLVEMPEGIEPLGTTDLKDKIEYNYYRSDYPANILNGYQDEDLFASRTLYTGAPAIISKLDAEKEEYHLGYFNAPRVFKVVIILEEDDTMIVSKVIERKLFNSSMTYELSDVDLSSNQFGVGVLEENIPYNNYTLSLIIRVIVTIAVELFILWLFKYKSIKSFKLTGFTNLVTQTILSLFMVIGFYFWGSIFGLLFVLVIGEFLVFVFEMAIYAKYLKEKGHGRALLYGFVANLVTLFLTIFTLGLL
jgi:hypothetical protein